MRRRLSAILMTVLGALVLSVCSPMLAPTQVFANAPLAVLLSCQGDVVVNRGGEAIKGTFGFQLKDGDEVETRTGGSAEILWENGSLAQLGPGSRMPIGSTRKPAPAPEQASLGDEGFQVVQNFIKLKDSEGTSSVGRLRSGDKSPEISADSPTKTAIQNGLPTFRWSTTEDVTDVKLTVYNEEGVHWETTVSGKTSVHYPADAPPLVAGVAYSWVVETADPLQFPPLRSATAYFEIISADQVKALDKAIAEIDVQDMPSPAAFHLVRASLYFSYGLMNDAIAETREALMTDVENPTLQSILAHLYAQVGATDAAMQEYHRLLQAR